MQYVTTISQKGQIVVPKDIRDKLAIKPSDPLKVTMGDKKIIVEPLSSVEEYMGMFKVRKTISKKDIKNAYLKHTSKKFK